MQLLNSSMVCCTHQAGLNIVNITLWFSAVSHRETINGSIVNPRHLGGRTDPLGPPTAARGAEPLAPHPTMEPQTPNDPKHKK